MAGEPQTHKEALLAEILGDVGLALDRLEALKADLPAAAQAAAGRIEAATAASIAAQARASSALAGDLERERLRWAAAAGELTKEAVAAAAIVQNGARSMVVGIVGLALLGGGVAGLVAGWAISAAMGR